VKSDCGSEGLELAGRAGLSIIATGTAREFLYSPCTPAAAPRMAVLDDKSFRGPAIHVLMD